MEERDLLEDLGINGRFKMGFKKYDGKAWSGFIW
jgi:hypothetical protein